MPSPPPRSRYVLTMSRVVVPPKKMVPILEVWLRHIPAPVRKAFTDELAEYNELAKQRRQPAERPDAMKLIAEHIAGRFEALGWEVSHPAPEHPGSPPAWGERRG